MKKIKIIIGIALIATVVLTFAGINAVAKKENVNQEMIEKGVLSKEIREKNGKKNDKYSQNPVESVKTTDSIDADEVVAQGGDIIITIDNLDSMKQMYELNAGKTLDTEVVINYIGRNKYIELAAKEIGLKVDSKEIDEFIISQKEAINESEELTEQIKDFANAQGLSVEEYYEVMRPGYESTILIGKYKKYMLENDLKSKISDVKSAKLVWDEYMDYILLNWKELAEELKSKQ